MARPDSDPPLAEEVLFPQLGQIRAIRAAKESGPFDLEYFADIFFDRSIYSSGDFRVHYAYKAFEKQLNGMDAKELAATGDAISTLNLPEKEKWVMASLVVDALFEKSPELTFRQFFGIYKYDQAFLGFWENWCGTDPVAATAWFDEQIEAGKFEPTRLDGSGGCRTIFEESLVKALLLSDPTAAVKRIEAVPKERWKTLLQSCSFPARNESGQKEWASLIRNHLSEVDSLNKIVEGTPLFVKSGYFPKVADFIDRIEATPEERSACVRKATGRWAFYTSINGSVTIEGIESLRAWADSQVPGISQDLTQQVVSSMLTPGSSKMSLENIKMIAAHYQGLEGGDELIAKALDYCLGVAHNKEFVRSIAAVIKNGERRVQILRKLDAQ